MHANTRGAPLGTLLTTLPERRVDDGRRRDHATQQVRPEKQGERRPDRTVRIGLALDLVRDPVHRDDVQDERTEREEQRAGYELGPARGLARQVNAGHQPDRERDEARDEDPHEAEQEGPLTQPVEQPDEQQPDGREPEHGEHRHGRLLELRRNHAPDEPVHDPEDLQQRASTEEQRQQTHDQRGDPREPREVGRAADRLRDEAPDAGLACEVPGILVGRLGRDPEPDHRDEHVRHEEQEDPECHRAREHHTARGDVTVEGPEPGVDER